MAVESVNRAPSFKGGYYKLFNKWENAFLHGTESLETPIENIVREAQDVVILTATGKGRFWNICEKIDSIFNKTPIILTDNEAFAYKFLTEKTNAKAHEALNYVLKQAMEILSPDYRIVKHKSLEALIPHIAPGITHKSEMPSRCKKIPTVKGKHPHLITIYDEPSQLPSIEALRFLKRGFNVKKLHSIDFNAVK